MKVFNLWTSLLIFSSITFMVSAHADLTCGRVLTKKGKSSLSVKTTTSTSCPKGFTLLVDTTALTNSIKAQISQGPQGTTGVTGSTGATGATGAAGTNATVDGVAAGGSLSGTYPNPSLGLQVVGPLQLQQMPGVKVVTTSQITFPSSTAVFPTFNSEVYDTSNFFTPGNGFVTVTVSGLYLVIGQINYIIDVTATGFRTCSLRKNDVEFASTSWAASSSQFTSAITVSTARLVEGDKISISGAQNSGSNKVSVSSNGGHTSLQLQWLAP